MQNKDWRPDYLLEPTPRCTQTFELPLVSADPHSGIPSGTIELFWQSDPPEGWEIVKGVIVCRKV